MELLALIYFVEDFGTVHPTMGFSRAELNVKKYKLTVYDLGGSQRIRDIWPTYFAEVCPIIYYHHFLPDLWPRFCG